jgi:hypothetical protein
MLLIRYGLAIGQSPSVSCSFFRSNPNITSSPSTTVTGVPTASIRSNLANASSSWVTSLVVKPTPFSLRNFSVLAQNSQPG